MCEPWEDLPRDEFCKKMAERFKTAWGGAISDWIELAQASLDFVLNGQRMDEVDYDWCESAAKEWAEEEMSYT